jgi:hypothetical protein
MSENQKQPEMKGFNLAGLSNQEIKEMFQNVSPRSLPRWLEYYESKEEFEICVIIKSIFDLKKGEVDKNLE